DHATSLVSSCYRVKANEFPLALNDHFYLASLNGHVGESLSILKRTSRGLEVNLNISFASRSIETTNE
ncbi:unnamed protein product, partial [Rotaria sordida]